MRLVWSGCKGPDFIHTDTPSPALLAGFQHKEYSNTLQARLSAYTRVVASNFFDHGKPNIYTNPAHISAVRHAIFITHRAGGAGWIRAQVLCR